ncbi:MAG: DUF2851 family protein [Chitinophagaceae bacterium]
MNEKLFQFIWQFQYFQFQALQTVLGEPIIIHKQGIKNQHQGPDFLDAKVSIGNVQLIGNIELHLNSSDWLKHQHTNDPHFSNIILHVVWQHDVDVTDIHGNILPVLELQNRVPKTLIDNYLALMLMPNTPCQRILTSTLNEIGWIAWKERLVAERLERKAGKILDLLHESKQHWEEVFWWQIAANFGMKVNSDLFENMAKSISINILAKHKNQLLQLEALLLGQSNLLNQENSSEAYVLLLQKEYQFLQKKYILKPNAILPKFLRMRPANFPTIRLAQLAALIHQSSHLFSVLKECNRVEDVKKLFNISASEFWNTHYQIDVSSSENISKQIGEDTIHNIIINTVVPILFAYGIFMKDEQFKEKAIQWLMQTKSESNHITISWKELKHKVKTALDSQAYIELTNEYCNKKRCLECAVGNSIIKSKTV